MTNSLPEGQSIFRGDWEMAKREGSKILLKRKVIVAGKKYIMTVGYHEKILENIQDPSKTELIIKRAIECASREIHAFVASCSESSEKKMSVTLQVGVNERAESAGHRGVMEASRETASSLERIKATNKKKYDATTSLISKFSSEYFRLFSFTPQQWVYELRRHEQVTIEFEEVVQPRQFDTKYRGEEIAQRALDHMQHTEAPNIDKYGCRLWKFELDGVPYEVNEYAEGAYNGKKNEDFLKREELVIEAAKRFVNDDPSALNAIAQLDAQFCEDIQRLEYQIDTDRMQQETDFEQLTQEYRIVNQNAVNLIAQLIKDLEHVISESVGKTGISVQKLFKEENLFVREQDRPVIINLYQYQGTRYLHMHTPESKEHRSIESAIATKTIPTTERSIVGLANYIATYGGRIDDEGNVSISYYALRHTSYPTIKEPDRYLRQAYTLENVRQELRDLASKSLAVNPRNTSRDNPLEISLRTMMLFSPKMGDFLRNRKKGIFGAWAGEGEVTQLEDSLLGLRALHGRTFPLQLGTDTVWVKPDLSAMNLGANAPAAGIGFFGKVPTNGLQHRMNARGFVTFIDEVEGFFQTTELPASIKKLIEEAQQLEQGSPDIKKARAKLANIIREKEADLRNKYEMLDSLFAEYRETKSWVLKFRMFRLRSSARRDEQAIDKAHMQLVSQLRTTFIRQKRNIELKEQAIAAALKSAELENALVIRNNLFKAKELFFENKTTQRDTLLDFQAIYITTHSLLNNYVNFFCKSGKDRTGRMDNKAWERELRKDAEKRGEVDEKEIANVVHKYSPSQHTAVHNVYARGLQISRKVDKDILAAIDGLAATISKRPYAKAKKCKPSALAIRLAQNIRFQNAA